jgi:hypothetical protein
MLVCLRLKADRGQFWDGGDHVSDRWVAHPLCSTAANTSWGVDKGRTYLSRSTNVMFSAISATRFAILDAIMVYGDMFG